MDHHPLVQVVELEDQQILMVTDKEGLHLVVLVVVEIVHQVQHQEEHLRQEVVVDQEVKQEMDMVDQEDRE